MNGGGVPGTGNDMDEPPDPLCVLEHSGHRVDTRRGQPPPYALCPLQHVRTVGRFEWNPKWKIFVRQGGGMEEAPDIREGGLVQSRYPLSGIWKNPCQCHLIQVPWTPPHEYGRRPANVCGKNQEVLEEMSADVADPGMEGSICEDAQNIFKSGHPRHPPLWIGDMGGNPCIGWTLGVFQNWVTQHLNSVQTRHKTYVIWMY